MNSVAIIVIGLNEEKNLAASLSAVTSLQIPGCKIEITYVDSGSTDKSVEIAESFSNVSVVHLDDEHPSAAKARNLGISATNSDFIQFIDGDSVLNNEWLINALPVLSTNDDIGVVFGSIDEVGEQNSFYMRVCRFDWYMPPGDYRLCGGNALWKRTVFEQAGIFDGQLIAGEEPDLCFRVRQHGYRIVCLDRSIVKHDLDMNTFKEYWNRSVRSGKAYSIIAMRYRGTDEKLWFKEMLRNYLEVIILILLIMFGIAYSWEIASIMFVVISIYRITKVMSNVWPRANGIYDAFLYGVHIQFSRIPLVYGQIIGHFELLLNFLGIHSNKHESHET